MQVGSLQRLGELSGIPISVRLNSRSAHMNAQSMDIEHEMEAQYWWGRCFLVSRIILFYAIMIEIDAMFPEGYSVILTTERL